MKNIHILFCCMVVIYHTTIIPMDPPNLDKSLFIITYNTITRNQLPPHYLQNINQNLHQQFQIMSAGTEAKNFLDIFKQVKTNYACTGNIPCKALLITWSQLKQTKVYQQYEKAFLLNYTEQTKNTVLKTLENEICAQYAAAIKEEQQYPNITATINDILNIINSNVQKMLTPLPDHSSETLLHFLIKHHTCPNPIAALLSYENNIAIVQTASQQLILHFTTLINKIQSNVEDYIKNELGRKRGLSDDY